MNERLWVEEKRLMWRRLPRQELQHGSGKVDNAVSGWHIERYHR